MGANKHLSRIFGAIDTKYFVRAYLFSVTIAVIAYFFLFSKSAVQDINVPLRLKFIFCIILGSQALLFPFAKFAWGELVKFIMGDNVIRVGFFLRMLWKLIVYLILFIVSPLVAPFGILTLWFVGRNGE